MPNMDMNGNLAPPDEILITERPDVLQTIVSGIGNALAPYGGVEHGGQKLFFVGLVLGYTKPDDVTGEIKKYAVTSFAANFTSIPASALYDSAAHQAAAAEKKASNEAKRDQRQHGAEVHGSVKQGH